MEVLDFSDFKSSIFVIDKELGLFCHFSYFTSSYHIPSQYDRVRKNILKLMLSHQTVEK